MAKYRKRSGDRKEGRLLRSLPAYTAITPFIMKNRNDACNHYEESFEISDLDKWLRKQRVNGYKGLGMLHFFIAAYVRCVSMLPAINRFVVGRRIYARDNIEVVMTIKREIALEASETSIKVIFEPTDTIYDVYRKMNQAIDSVKSSEENNGTEDVADVLCKLPRFILNFAIRVLRVMDYFGWLPQALLNVSPFHGSMIITDLGSLRIGPIFHHIYNFGTLPVFISFGAKRHAYEVNRHGQVEDHKYVDTKMVLDERICDGHYYSQFLQAFRYIIKHPEILENQPSKIIEDRK